MSYAKMLDEMIRQSELSLRQISKRCFELGISITPSYVSQLRNGKLPPPSEEISLALSKVCGSKNQSHLVFQGYMEKAPAIVREYMLASSSLNKVMLESLCKAAGSMPEDFKKFIEELDVLAALEMSSKFVSAENPAKAHDLVKEIALATNKAVKLDETSEMINFFVPDSSMSPLIPIHSYVYILPTRKDLLKDRDIIAFYPPNSKSISLRKLFNVHGQLVLIPEDKSHALYVFNDLSDINYIGKVVSYKADL